MIFKIFYVFQEDTFFFYRERILIISKINFPFLRLKSLSGLRLKRLARKPPVRISKWNRFRKELSKYQPELRVFPFSAKLNRNYFAILIEVIRNTHSNPACSKTHFDSAYSANKSLRISYFHSITRFFLALDRFLINKANHKREN